MAAAQIFHVMINSALGDEPVVQTILNAMNAFQRANPFSPGAP
jgi:hypothetical protein